MTPFSAARLRAALRARGLRPADVSRELGAGPSTVRNWLAGIHAPTGATLQALRRLVPELDETDEAPKGREE